MDENVVRHRRGRRDADSVLAAALAAGATQQEAARIAGIGERTVRRRLDDDAFVALVEELRRETVRATADALRGAAVGAVATLVELQAPTAPPAVRLGAARAVLDQLVRYERVAEFAERLANIERSLGLETITVSA